MGAPGDRLPHVKVTRSAPRKGLEGVTSPPRCCPGEVQCRAPCHLQVYSCSSEGDKEQVNEFERPVSFHPAFTKCYGSGSASVMDDYKLLYVLGFWGGLYEGLETPLHFTPSTCPLGPRVASGCPRSARQERTGTVLGGWGWPQRQHVAPGRWQPRSTRAWRPKTCSSGVSGSRGPEDFEVRAGRPRLRDRTEEKSPQTPVAGRPPGQRVWARRDQKPAGRIVPLSHFLWLCCLCPTPHCLASFCRPFSAASLSPPRQPGCFHFFCLEFLRGRFYFQRFD